MASNLAHSSSKHDGGHDSDDNMNDSNDSESTRISLIASHAMHWPPVLLSVT